jgi:hypothetical protein
MSATAGGGAGMPRATVPVTTGEPGAAGPAPPISERPEFRGNALMGALSGIVFAVLFAVAFVLVHQAPGLAVPDSVYTQFYAGNSDALVALGLYVVPFAGIAFLWHMTATRTLVEAASQIPHWLHLASGILLVMLMFAGTAAVGALALLTVFSAAPLPSVDVARALTATGYGLVFVFGVRATGMYMITATTLLRGTGILPRWLVLAGYLAAAFLLVSTTFHPAVLMVFPAWVVAVSVAVLVRGLRTR